MQILKYIWKNKVLLVLLILAVWLVPITISIPEQSRTDSIITAVGVDKMDNGEYEVSLQYIIPHASTSNESLKMSSQKGRSVEDAINKLNAHLGKLSGFAHCRVIVFNDKACEENFTQVLDSFVRQKTNANNIVLINTKKSAKDLLNCSNNLDGNLYSYLNNSAFSYELKDYEDLKSIGDYYRSLFSVSKCLMINVIDVESGKNTEKNSSSEGSQDNGGGDSGASSGSSDSSFKQNKLVNEGKSIIIKDEKKLLELDVNQSNKLKWFNKDIKQHNFELINFSDESLENADLIFTVYDKNVKNNVYFKNGIPHFDINLKIFIRTAEVVAKNMSQENYEIQQQIFTEKLYSAIKNKIKTDMAEAEIHFKENKYDILNCEELFRKLKNKEYNNFISNFNQNESFINNVVFSYSVDVAKGS